MRLSEVRSWKKVFESDLSYIVYEMKDILKTPCLVILEGTLGAGKTTFTKEFVDEGETSSPSYSIVSETKDVLHADFYRIKSREEIIHLELPLYLEGKNYFFAEWGAKHLESINKELPDDFSIYHLEITINEKHDSQDIESRNFVLSEYKI
jgi:tRNA threonylcarbamoyladenosine biosynthesis protein TsaE